MTDMAAARRTCIIWVMLEYEDYLNLWKHRRNESVLKKRILDFIRQLQQKGIRHFIIFINDAVDFWLAELLYFMQISNNEAVLTYSLYLASKEAEHIDGWMTDEYYFDEVISHAKNIHWCSGYFRMPAFPLMLLNLTSANIYAEDIVEAL